MSKKKQTDGLSAETSVFPFQSKISGAAKFEEEQSPLPAQEQTAKQAAEEAGLPPPRRIFVRNWRATTRVPKKVWLKPEDIDERTQMLQSINPEIERVELRLQPELDALGMLKMEKKRLAAAVHCGYEFTDVAVMEVPDEKLKVVRFVDAEGVVVGSRPLTEEDLQEKLV